MWSNGSVLMFLDLSITTNNEEDPRNLPLYENRHPIGQFRHVIQIIGDEAKWCQVALVFLLPRTAIKTTMLSDNRQIFLVRILFVTV
jgi:hypothetical protein